jgi:hypothetical protein
LKVSDKYLRALDALAARERLEEVKSDVIGYAESDVARGDDLSDEVLLVSEVEGVSDDKWTDFVRRMMTAPLDSVSDSNALGMFELSPRRLADFGYVDASTLQRAYREAPSGKRRTIWVGKFVEPLTPRAFLRSVRAQYQVFCQSMRDYVRRIETGEIDPPEELTLSGMLAVLHRCGPKGAEIWANGERFPGTVELVERVNEVF